MQSALSSLFEMGHHLFLPEIVQQCISVFENPQLTLVTNDDYGILLTPEDEVYNNPVIQRLLSIISLLRDISSLEI